MMRSSRICLVLAVAPALVAAACGGSIDLEGPRPPSPAATGGSPSTAAAGSSPSAQAGDTPSEQPAAGGKAEPTVPSEDAAGAPPAPVTTGEPKIAFLAFDAEPEGERRGIYWVSAPTGDCRERLSPDDVNAKQPAFSKDGKLIAYAAEDEDGTYQIFTWETGSRRAHRVTSLPEGATYPAFSPEGGSLAFVTGDPEGMRDGLVDDTPDMGNLMLLNLQTLEAQLLEPRNSTLDYPYFAPAFATRDSLLVSDSYAIRELRLKYSGQEVRVVSRRPISSPGVPQEPAPSPDGSSVAYPDTCGDTLRLYAHSIALGSPRSCTPASRDYLPDAGVRSPDWGAFGFIAAAPNAPNAQGLQLFDEHELSLTLSVATPPHPRNPSWGPADFTRQCP